MRLFKSLDIGDIFYTSLSATESDKWKKISHIRAVPINGAGSAQFRPTEVIITLNEYTAHNRPATHKPDDILLWPDSTWCFRHELSQYSHMSDDYETIKSDSGKWATFIAGILAPSETPQETQ